MTYEELLAKANAEQPRSKLRHMESHLQRNCITWFRLQYPKLAKLCFAVPNGGWRNRREARIMKAEGVTPGVADVILLKPSGGFASLCIEFKTEDKGSRQQESQKEWQAAAEEAGNRYELIRTFDRFREVVTEYLNPDRNGG